MNPNLLAVRPRWANVANIVSERLGKAYGGDYIQQVSSGIRINSKVAGILSELGMMKTQLSKLAPPTPRTKRGSARSLAA